VSYSSGFPPVEHSIKTIAARHPWLAPAAQFLKGLPEGERDLRLLALATQTQVEFKLVDFILTLFLKPYRVIPYVLL